MADEKDLVLLNYQQKDRSCIFLMTSAGASIGYSIALKSSLSFGWPDFLIILGVLSFGLSFWSGYRYLVKSAHLTYINAGMIQATREFSGMPSSEIKAEFQREAFDPALKIAVRFSRLQIYTLITGAAFLMASKIAAAYPQFDLFKTVFDFTKSVFN